MDEVNDKYVFYKLVESTIDNYRNVMYMKHPTPGNAGKPLYLMRAKVPKWDMVWESLMLKS